MQTWTAFASKQPAEESPNNNNLVATNLLQIELHCDVLNNLFLSDFKDNVLN